SAGALPAAATSNVTVGAATAAASGAAGAGSGDPSSDATLTLTEASIPRLIVPDVIASVPGGVTKADLDRLRKLSGVRAVLAIDGAENSVNRAQRTLLA